MLNLQKINKYKVIWISILVILFIYLLIVYTYQLRNDIFINKRNFEIVSSEDFKTIFDSTKYSSEELRKQGCVSRYLCVIRKDGYIYFAMTDTVNEYGVYTENSINLNSANSDKTINLIVFKYLSSNKSYKFEFFRIKDNGLFTEVKLKLDYIDYDYFKPIPLFINEYVKYNVSESIEIVDFNPNVRYELPEF